MSGMRTMSSMCKIQVNSYKYHVLTRPHEVTHSKYSLSHSNSVAAASS